MREVTVAVPRRLDSPMVGPRTAARAAAAGVRRGVEGDDACQLFTLLGSAGVGKSRLVEEFLSSSAAAPRCSAAGACPTARASRTSRSSRRSSRPPAWPTSTSPDVVESKVCSVLEGDEHQELVCRHVSQLMGVAEAAAGEETFWAIRRFFEAVGARASAGARVRRHPLGRAHVPRPASSTSRTGRAARRSCCCAWRAPTCSTSGRRGEAGS